MSVDTQRLRQQISRYLLKQFIKLIILLVLVLSLAEYAQSSSKLYQVVNGTDAGIWEFKATAPVPLRKISDLIPEQMAADDEMLYFSVSAPPNDSSDNAGLWRWRFNLAEGMLRDPLFFPEQMIASGSWFFFSESGPSYPYSSGVWANNYHSTPNQTIYVSDLIPEQMVASNGRLFFSVVSGSSTGIWEFDATASGDLYPRKLSEVIPEQMAASDDSLYFSIASGSDAGIWLSVNGSTPSRVSSLIPEQMTAADDSLYFSIASGSDAGIWLSVNGSTPSRISSFIPEKMAASDNSLYFSIASGSDAGIWLSTNGSTPSQISSLVPELIVATSGKLYFSVATIDLSITKVSSPNLLLLGDNLTYTMTVTNNDSVNLATGVTLTDTLPTGVAFGSVTSTQGNCVETSGIITCNLGVINKSDIALATVVVTPTIAGTITNTASVSGNETDSNTSNNTASANSMVFSQPTANLAITKRASPELVGMGRPLTYTIDVVNSGPSPATGVTLNDSLPSSVSFVSATSNQGSCGQASGTVSCILGTINNNAPSSDNYSVTIVVIPTVTGTITNTVTVFSNEPDPFPINNTASENTTVVESTADLNITKRGAPGLITVGYTLTYFIDIANSGPFAATGVTLSDSLPSSVGFVSADATQGSCTEAGDIVTCNLDTININHSTSVTITVIPTISGTITNTVTVFSHEPDPFPINNTASENTNVTTLPVADLRLIVSDWPDPWFAGRPATYTVHIINNGPSPATGVVLNDNLPVSVSFVSATPSQGSCGQVSGTVSCDLGTIGSGNRVRATLVVIPNSTGTITNIANVTGNELDPPANNTDSDTTQVVPVVDLVVDGLEVTQAVQNLNNDVRLVAGKRTFVRVHVHSEMGGVRQTIAQLYVRGETGGGQMLYPVPPTQLINVHPLATRDRVMLNHAFLFELPSRFTREGRVTLNAYVNNPFNLAHWKRDPIEIDYSNNFVTTTVSFETVPRMNLLLYNVEYEFDGSRISPARFHRTHLEDLLQRAYPIGTNGLWVHNRSIYQGTGFPDCSDVNMTLDSHRIWDEQQDHLSWTGVSPRYYGMYDDEGRYSPTDPFDEDRSSHTEDPLGCADSFRDRTDLTFYQLVASGQTGVPGDIRAWDTDGSYGDWIAAHELAHTYERSHVRCYGEDEVNFTFRKQGIETRPDKKSGR